MSDVNNTNSSNPKQDPQLPPSTFSEEGTEQGLDSLSSNPNASNTSTAEQSSQQTSNQPQGELENINTTLTSLNSIKGELVKLPLNPLQLEYYNNSVVPLLTTLYDLSTTSLNLASSSNFLATNIVVHPKKSKIDDTVHLVYKINEKCEDLYKVLKRRIDALIDLEERKY
jgi:hypothetical protein